MYKFLLSWRYLRTRYIALASIISVTLGVATLVVVNAVMNGFTTEMHHRLHGILSDLVFESHGMGGFPDPDWHVHEIRKVLGDDLEGITATVHVPAMLNFQVRGQWVTRQVNLIGIDEQTYGNVSDFGQYLLHPSNRDHLQFLLREEGYAPGRDDFPEAGWTYRRQRAAWENSLHEASQLEQAAQGSAAPLPQDPFATASSDPTAANGAPNVFDPAKEQHTGVVLGIAIASLRHRNPDGKVQDYYLCRPGDDVKISFPKAVDPSEARTNELIVSDNFTIVDLYESRMSEYDSSFAFVPLDKMQEMRGMIDPLSGVPSVTSIQIKLAPGVNLVEARDRLQARFPVEDYGYRIQTWRDLQGPLLAAVQMETTLLNILLFLIIAVAGFGILATFFMIVVEKTRDIGILKALGAPSSGVMSIFLSYGFSLGIVGSGVGMALGLLFVAYINEIARGLETITGREVFDPTVYYFQEIPTINEPMSVLGVVLGAVMIAVLASVLPALRAARLHPVEALRYE